MLTDGAEERVKITDVSSTEIRYKRCDFLNGPSYVISKNKVFMMIYANGRREVIQTKASQKTALKGNESDRGPRKLKKIFPAAAKFSLISSIICGVLAIVSTFILANGLLPLFGLGVIAVLILSTVSIGMGIYANSEIKQNPDELRGHGMTTPAIVVSSCMLLLFLIIGLALFL
jgi:hypothetical protein